jgi:glycosyltransferase involved in cell wall biosynthesis
VTAGFYAPLPPAPTGIADYAAALLQALRRLGSVHVAPERCEVALYHLGNNSLHAEIYRRALERPGVVVLHDALLHHFLLGQLNERDYIDEFVYNYGGGNRGLAEELWRGRAASSADSRYFRFPMLKRVAVQARAVVVHNPAATRAVREHAPQARIVEIPHLFQPPTLPTQSEVARYRKRLVLAPNAFVFGVFGYLRESKRLVTVLETFNRLHRENASTALIVAGSFTSIELERAITPLLVAPGVVRLAYLDAHEFWLAASAVDAGISLRDPAAGETSGITIRLMGIGKPVLVTDAEENALFPEAACLRIGPGVTEYDSLYSHLVLLTSVPGVARAIGMRAADHVRVHHSLDRVARLYWDILCDSCS